MPKDGQVLLDKFGKPVLDRDGNYILVGSDGIPRNTRGLPYLLNKNGLPIYGQDGEPIVIGALGKPLTSDGRPILMDHHGPVLGENGLPIVLGPTPSGNIKEINGKFLKKLLVAEKAPCGALCGMLKKDSKPNYLSDKYSNLIYDPDGNNILLGPDGVARSSDGRPFWLDSDGLPIFGADEKPIVIGLDGKPATLDGKPILLDENGRPVLGKDGIPIVLRTPPKGKIKMRNDIIIKNICLR